MTPTRGNFNSEGYYDWRARCSEEGFPYTEFLKEGTKWLHQDADGENVERGQGEMLSPVTEKPGRHR
jgi:hypothetical protein